MAMTTDGALANGHSNGHCNDTVALTPGAPVCLIRGGHEGLRVADEGQRLLESLHEPIAVVCLAGQYRTGKSFFLNQLALSSAASSCGFRVGPTTESCTRGIWLWDPQPPVRNARGERVLFMDTEGIAATDNDESYDAKIFSLGLLLSSLFVFNTMGVIDEGAIDRLFLVSELTKHVCISADTGSAQPVIATHDDAASDDPMAESKALAPHFPPFIWLLRDFMLDMQADGASLSPNEYLEKSLELRDGSSRRNDDRNKIRTSIRILFERRECLTLVRPVMDELQLRRAAELHENELRPEFVAQMQHVRARILSVVRPKLLLGKAMDGRKLAHLAKCYTETMTSGAIPDIKAAWAYVSEATCQTAMLNAMELYDARMARANYADEADDEAPQTNDTAVVAVAVLISQQEFEKLHKDAQDEALNMFKNQSVEGATRAACFQRLKTHIQKQKTALVAALQKKSTVLCENVLQELKREWLTQPLGRGQWDSAFFQRGNDGKIDMDAAQADAMLFAETLRCLEQIYEKKAHGPAKKVALFQFVREDVVQFFQDLFGRLSSRYHALYSDWQRQHEQLQHAAQALESQLRQQLHDRQVQIQLLQDAQAHAQAKDALQQQRIQELQNHSEQQQATIQSLEAKHDLATSQLTQLQQTQSALEMELEKTKIALDHTTHVMQQRDDELRQATSAWRLEVERLRETHAQQKDEWIQKLADQTADKNATYKALKLRDHELQQKTLAWEMATKHSEQLQHELDHERLTRQLHDDELAQVRCQYAALETQLEQRVAQHVRLQHDYECERERLMQRLSRFETQLGRVEADREVHDVLLACVTEVVRLAEVDKARVLLEERNVLQQRLGELLVKIATLPDFFQREIFCSPDPEPDFLDVLTQ